MNHQLRRTGTVILATALAILLALGTAGLAPAKKRLKVSCEQLYDAAAETARQLQAQYNAMGFSIENPPYTAG